METLQIVACPVRSGGRGWAHAMTKKVLFRNAYQQQWPCAGHLVSVQSGIGVASGPCSSLRQDELLLQDCGESSGAFEMGQLGRRERDWRTRFRARVRERYFGVVRMKATALQASSQRLGELNLLACFSHSCILISHCCEPFAPAFAHSSSYRYRKLQWRSSKRYGEGSPIVQGNGERQILVRMSRTGRSGGSKPVASDSGVLPASTAKDAIESGLSLFSKGRVKDALRQFDAALELNPTSEETQAALYNKACCHATREEGEKASIALRNALKNYGLKFSVILNDPDMAPFRAMQEFKQLQEEARRGGDEVGQGFRRDLKLIGEVQAPFRGVRKFFYVVFTLAAGISTLFTIPRLILAFQGGEDSPSLLGTSQNLAINLGGILVFVALYVWDNKKEEEQMGRIITDETLSRLPLRLQSNRVVELSQIRETTRPVIIAGKKEAVNKALQRARGFRDDLVKRGVVVIPIIWNSEIQEALKKKGFGSLEKPAVSSPVNVGDEFEKRAEDIAAKAELQAERQFKAEAVAQAEWERWIRDQQKSEGVTPGEDVYIVLRLDGRVRKSGLGMPSWQDLINELPTLDALMSKLEK